MNVNLAFKFFLKLNIALHFHVYLLYSPLKLFNLLNIQDLIFLQLNYLLVLKLDFRLHVKVLLLTQLSFLFTDAPFLVKFCIKAFQFIFFTLDHILIVFEG